MLLIAFLKKKKKTVGDIVDSCGTPFCCINDPEGILLILTRKVRASKRLQIKL